MVFEGGEITSLPATRYARDVDPAILQVRDGPEGKIPVPATHQNKRYGRLFARLALALGVALSD